MEAKQRAKLVLDLCADELKDVPVWAQANLEYAIIGQIEEALRVQMHDLNKMAIKSKQFGSELGGGNTGLLKLKINKKGNKH